jgi:hypothetical protein
MYSLADKIRKKKLKILKIHELKIKKKKNI